MNKVRCAIYTRKSSEEGLEQDFNSLHAQREACAAYILSQASEGWSLLPDEYDDGGLSGGTLERPALQRLLADIEAGKIDIVVVYKVDRLTRSLLDFAKLVETMDRAGVSFVSVTQSFNTTTSMGRLTLNMLLELRAVRARGDRRAHPRQDRRLEGQGHVDGRQPAARLSSPTGARCKVVEEHADTHPRVFPADTSTSAMSACSSTSSITRACWSPQRFTSTGRRMGGVPFTRGQIYKIFSRTRSTPARSTIRGWSTTVSTRRSLCATSGSRCRRGW